MAKRIELITTNCPNCKGGGTIYVPSNLLGWMAHGQDPGDREENCPACKGTGHGVPIPVEFDR